MSKTIPVVEKILSANDELSEVNRSRFDAARVFAMNFMASPGAGKTSVIEQTLKRLGDDLRLGVIEGDIATTIDAERVQEAGAMAVQINTGGNCHLEAYMIRDALSQLSLDELDMLVVENVGNLVCPANFKLGTHKNVLIASVPEGDDKPYKYPGMYRGVDVLILNKTDLLPYIKFNMDYFREGVEILNPGLTTFPVSCHTGEGFDAWIAWLREQAEAMRSQS
ncbi:MAG: hydrogenase nickel incorporation protein HypB [Chloroflexi bacterium]|nr:hydrogenase nickel incorporation protein HypB [Chloroflexota bacterium]